MGVKYMYRYESTYMDSDDFWYTSRPPSVFFTLYRFPVTKETRCGVWITVSGKKKFINISAKKQYAYKTEEGALRGYKARKHRQFGILKWQLKHVEAAINFLEANPGLPKADPCTVY